VLGDGGIAFGDDGSFLRLIYGLGENREHSNLTFAAFPVSSDRIRGGFSYAISWAGNAMFANNGLVPGCKLQLTQPRWYAYATGKATYVATPRIAAAGGGLFGAGVDVTETFAIEANGGIFSRGYSTRSPSLHTAAYGGTLQLAYHRGLPIGTSIDLQLYRNDPDQQVRFFAPEIYDDQWSVVVKSEATLLEQTVTTPAGQPVAQPAVAADLNFAAKYRKLRLGLNLVYQSAAFILFNVPSNPAGAAFPAGADAQPQAFFDVGFDYFFARAHLTPGLRAGVERPAFARGPGLVDPVTGRVTTAGEVMVFRGAYAADTLTRTVAPIYAATASCRWDASELISAIAAVLLRYDPDRAAAQPFSVGFNLMLQARF
jgi:hypothetical protein